MEATAASEEYLSCIIPKGCNDNTCKKFVFKNEDHTLGNSLRFIISRYPDVQFCAYTIPHPAEKEMVLQIQTDGIEAEVVLKRALQDLADVCDETKKKFLEAKAEFAKNPNKKTKS